MNKPIKYEALPEGRPDGMRWILLEDYVYYSRTFNRTKTLKKGMLSDGATGVSDLGAEEKGWRKYWVILLKYIVDKYFPENLKLLWDVLTAFFFVHDAFCEDPYWDDGTPASNFVVSTIAAAILYTDGYKVRSIPYWWATFLFGGKKVKELVGWIWIPEENKKIEEPVVGVNDDGN